MSNHVCDYFPVAFQATMSDTLRSDRQVVGAHLHFYGEVVAEGRIGKLHLKDKFIVRRIRDDMILGMPFIVNHGCVIHFGNPTIKKGPTLGVF